ncbi:MAG: DNA methyltransferase, partial [Sulfurimonas sp.]
TKKPTFDKKDVGLELNKIYLGDCLELMPKIKDKSVDLVLCDLPYGTTKNEWDTIIPYGLLWEQYGRIIKDNGAILLFSQSPFDKELAMSNIDLFRYEWIWEKTEATGFLNSSKMPLKAHENILVFYKKLPTYNPIMTKGAKKVSRVSHRIKCKESSNYGKHSMVTKDYCSDERYPRSVLKFPKDKQKQQLHPTQKPLAPIKYFIETYSNKGDVVLDNCVGSGTTPVGCIHTGRYYIGMEKFKDIKDVADLRVKEAIGDVGLFERSI